MAWEFYKNSKMSKKSRDFYLWQVGDGKGVWDNEERRKEAIRSVKKIPTVFKRTFDGGVGEGKITSETTPDMEWVIAGDGEATEKVDGSACAIINGELYKRYDAKQGKKPPEGAIPCQEKPDPYTGHWPHWVKVSAKDRGDKWFIAAYENTPWCREDGTYEAVGVHFRENAYGLDADFLERHGRIKIKDCPRTFEGIREYLRTHEIEGIVFWLDGEPRCKIKRRDFGFPWPVKEGK